MNIIEAIQRRHSVRQYLEKEIPEEIVERLLAAMRACKQVGGLHMHLLLHQPEAFSGLRSKAMRFRGVENYIVLAGEKDDTLEERCGYYGEKVVLLAQQLGLNTVIAQVRPFSDALYESELFPWSYLATGKEGVDPGFDPLAIMVEQAHQRGLQLHAWVNPYRVRTSATNKQLSSKNPAVKLLKSGDAIRYNGAVTYDPASKKAQQLIVDGVREIVEKYDVDGIHFDDYFYPTTDAGFDSASYQAYKNKGGSLSLAAWRRQNVNDLVKQVYTAVKQADGEVLFGISPQGNMDNNYNKQFIDVKKWLSEEGYLDYICPQVYFGFKNSTCPYEQTVEEWNDLIKNKVQLVVGLSPYKVGLEDAYAGNGRWEWANGGDILARMVETARKEEHYQGFALFRYNSVFQPESSVRPAILEELDSLQEVL